MTPFQRALRNRIQAEGGISVEAFMAACNASYYSSRDPLGTAGDFTTAPEISQMFGELVGAAMADCWLRAGAPDDAVYAELGPGRGTLAADALRVMRAAQFAGEVHLVETSPALRAKQAEAIPDAVWHEEIGDLPDRPLLLVANEFLDALPVRQVVDGEERRIVLTDDGLAFDRNGEVVETSPARDDAVKAIATKIARSGGTALIIDYGHERTAPGDTLQAVRRHEFASALADPGEQDLTAHVDFEAVARSAVEAGAQATALATQGNWLEKLGIQSRCEALIRANPERTAEIQTAAERLTAADQMGRLFKVIAIHARGWPIPAGLA